MFDLLEMILTVLHNYGIGKHHGMKIIIIMANIHIMHQLSVFIPWIRLLMVLGQKSLIIIIICNGYTKTFDICTIICLGTRPLFKSTSYLFPVTVQLTFKKSNIEC